jgi:hypothetical protein
MQARRSPDTARSALAKRRAEAEARAKDQIEILRISAAMRRHQSVADALQRILLRGQQFVLDRIAGIVQVHPWAVGPDGALLGHLLTIDDATFDSVAEDCAVELLTLPEALEAQWSDLSERAAWSGAYTAALRALADQEERNDLAMRQRAEIGGHVQGKGDSASKREKGGL